MTTLDKLPRIATSEPPEAADAVRALRTGTPITSVLADDPAERSALLETVLDSVVDLDTHFVRVANPLRAPLTIERIFLQVVGPEAEIRLERDPEALARILAAPFGEERAVIVIERCDTLDGEALDLLQAMASRFVTIGARVQILFCGPTSFRATGERPPQPSPAPAPAPAPLAVEPPRHEAPLALLPPNTAPRRSLRVLEFTCVAFGIALGLAVLAWDREPDLLRSVAAQLLQARVPASAEAAPSQPAVTPPSPKPDDLRQAFDRFLADRAETAGLSEAQKDALFNEFLRRRRPGDP